MDFSQLNSLGLIPGPNETKEDFLSRSEQCLNLKKSIVEQLDQDFPFCEEDLASPKIMEEAKPLTESLFDMFPSWVPLFFSNRKLAPWHGGCAWIFQLDKISPKLSLFQLRKDFSNQETYLSIYCRKELIAHEAAHVGRMAFNEPKFEEVLSYRTSPSHFRKYFGPIIQSPYESFLFLLSLLIAVLTVFWANSFMLFLIPAGLISLALMRLWKRQRQFSRTLHNLKKLFKDERKANGVIFRLTDKEIITFSKVSLRKIKEYAQQQKSLRWQILNQIYF